MELEDIISEIDIWQEWHDSYCYFVPKFIESAQSCESWQDWDNDLFCEFFERGGDHCVSSLKQGYFTKEEKSRIKTDWKELAPMLKAIAESQDKPLWNTYDNIKAFIRQRTSQDRRAATNRLIASLQPNLLCTIVQEGYLRETFILMEKAGLTYMPNYDENNWFKSSNILLDYFKSNIQTNSPYDICTYPWQVREYLKNISEEQAHYMENIKSYINLLKANKNLVLTGAPGTGKTYLAKEIAKAMDAEVEFVQFHPSYDYTDFVEGLRPIDEGEGHINFERKDGVFKKFCKRALYKDSECLLECWNLLVRHLASKSEHTELSFHSKDVFASYITFNKETSCIEIANYRMVAGSKIEAPAYSFSFDKLLSIYNGLYSKANDDYNHGKMVLGVLYNYFGLIPHNKIGNEKTYVFIIDEINRGELSKIFGELFYAIDPGYRGEKGKVKTQYQNLIDKDDLFSEGFYVPENVYILATMNDIDRSVESMDFALRRRFAWKEIKPKERLDMLSEKLDQETCTKAVRVMTALNNEISKTRGLGSAYQIGPAYFLRLDENHYDGDFMALWDMHIEILLKEYLRGYSNAEVKLEEFKNLYLDSLNVTPVDAID